MQVDTGKHSTLISSKIWTELVKSQLDGKIRHLEAYDDHLRFWDQLLVTLSRNSSCAD